MKAFLTTTIVFCLLAITCSAQWSGGTASGDNKVYLTTSSDLVGIGTGTSTPGLKAHIVGAVGFPATSGTSQTGVLRLQGLANNSVLDFSVNGAFGASLQATALNDLSLKYPLLLNPNGGNVGIGITAPENKLHIMDVTGTNTLNLQLSTNTINETIGIAFGTQPGDRTKAAVVGVNTNAGNAGGALAFYTNAGTSLNEVMRITSAGKVAIGTTSPNAKVDIQLATSTTPLTTADEGLRLSTSATSTSNTTHISSPFIKLFGGIWNGTGNSSRGFTQQVTGVSGTNSGYRLAVGSTDVTDALSITGLTGNVGIGTTTPDQKLSVNGNIHGKSMIVDLVGLPDYVFHSNYYLPTLESVQAYIDKNHHLQEVPSATEVEKSGMNLGEMNKVLLKKVEELTLYVIDINKQLKQTQKEVKRLKRKK